MGGEEENLGRKREQKWKGLTTLGNEWLEALKKHSHTHYTRTHAHTRTRHTPLATLHGSLSVSFSTSSSSWRAGTVRVLRLQSGRCSVPMQTVSDLVMKQLNMICYGSGVR